MDPWVTADVVLADEAFCSLDETDDALIAAAGVAAQDASDILLLLSGNTLGGPRSVTVWPESTNDYGYWYRYQPGGIASVLSDFQDPTRITLQWPVISVDDVEIDGDTVDPATYEVQGQMFLVRLPNSDGVPQTWPISRFKDGNFSITYTFGQSFPAWAIDAARELSVSLLRNRLGIGSPLPAGVGNVNKQGISYSIPSQAQALRDKASTENFPSVIRFLSLINPQGDRMAPWAWSPDLGRRLHVTTPVPGP